MIDAPEVLRAFLATKTTLTALIGDRLWPQRTFPIEGYLPSQGQAIVFRPRGSGTVDYSGNVYTLSWAFKCYGRDELEADQLYRTLFDVLHDAKGAGLFRAALEVGGQPLQEPVIKWDYCLSYWTTLMPTYYEPV